MCVKKEGNHFAEDMIKEDGEARRQDVKTRELTTVDPKLSSMEFTFFHKIIRTMTSDKRLQEGCFNTFIFTKADRSV